MFGGSKHCPMKRRPFVSDHSARPSRFPWPPVIYVLAALLAIFMHQLFPLPWIIGPLADILVAIGWLMIVAALFIDVLAMRALRRAATTIMPNRRSEHLVVGGPYALSRNPIYLGNTMIMIGVAFIWGNVWFLAFGLVGAFLTQKLAIEREERHLETRFGKVYRDYRKRVRRWF